MVFQKWQKVIPRGWDQKKINAQCFAPLRCIILSYNFVTILVLMGLDIYG